MSSGAFYELYKVLKFSQNLALVRDKFSHNFLEKLSTNVTKYLAPPVELILNGLHTSE